jgi:hypothetical protein
VYADDAQTAGSVFKGLSGSVKPHFQKDTTLVVPLTRSKLLTKIIIAIEVELDPIPGAFHTKQDAVRTVDAILNGRISHYNPRVLEDLVVHEVKIDLYDSSTPSRTIDVFLSEKNAKDVRNIETSDAGQVYTVAHKVEDYSFGATDV